MKIKHYFSICLSVVDFGVAADSPLTKNVPKLIKKNELRGSGNDRRALSSVGIFFTFDIYCLLKPQC